MNIPLNPAILGLKNLSEIIQGLPENIEGSTRSYTLIDGFDKLDVSQFAYREAGEGGSWSSSSNLTSAQPVYYNYRFLPYATGPLAYRYLPDMWRYLSGRRFTLGSTGLMYPKVENLMRYAAYRDLWKTEAMFTQTFYSDLFSLQERLNMNFQIFYQGSLMSLDPTFQFDNFFHAPAASLAQAAAAGMDSISYLYPNMGGSGVGVNVLTTWKDQLEELGNTFDTILAHGDHPAITGLDKRAFIGSFHHFEGPGQPMAGDTADYFGFPIKFISLFPSQDLLWEDLEGWDAIGLGHLDLLISQVMGAKENFFTTTLQQMMFPAMRRNTITGLLIEGNEGDIQTEQSIGPVPSHIYYVSKHRLAMSLKEAQAIPEFDYALPSNDMVEIKPYYNYYKVDMPEVPTSPGQVEWVLPNLYTFNAYKSSKASGGGKNFTTSYFSKLTTLDTAPSWESGITPKTFTLQEYISLAASRGLPSDDLPWVDDITQEALPIDIPVESMTAAQRYHTVVLCDKELMNSTRVLKKMYPYGVDVSITSTKPSEFMKNVAEHAAPAKRWLLNSFMSMLGNYFSSFGGQSSEAHKYAVVHDYAGTEFVGLYPDPTKSISMADLQILDLRKAYDPAFQSGVPDLEKYYEHYGKYINDSKNVKLSKITNIGYEYDSDGQAEFTSVFKGAVESYLEGKTIAMEGIMKGQGCHSEIVAFEVAKFKRQDYTGEFSYYGKRKPPLAEGDTVRKEHVQSIFIPNVYEANETLSYLDTQVFYDTEYIYEIYALTLVVGAEYNYWTQGTGYNIAGKPVNNLIESEQSAYTAKIKNIENPSGGEWKTAGLNGPGGDAVCHPVIVRAPYYNCAGLGSSRSEQKTTKILSKPPLPPQVSFHAYKDAEDKVLILLNQNYGQRALIPNTQVFPGDAAKVAEYKIAQSEDEKPEGHIIYRTDDMGGAYEVYRLDFAPSSWSDCQLAAKVFDSPVVDRSGFNDNIAKNQDYYYFARLRDIHGNISNPSHIFKVRIIKEEGFPPYMALESYNFPKMEDSISTVLSFQKYLKIDLNDMVREADATGLNPGTSSKATIGYITAAGGEVKKYKFRITSMDTGKKIDINVDIKPQVESRFTTQDLEKIEGDPIAPVAIPGTNLGGSNAPPDVLDATNLITGLDDV